MEEVTFEEALKRSNIQSGDTLSDALGKIAKIYSDINNVAFSGEYDDLTGTPTSMKNPQAITFTGSVTGTYDGSAAKTVNIPSIPTSLPANGGTAQNVSGIIAITNGGTGANNVATARTNLGLGAAATQEVVNNLSTIVAGSVLDARQGKQLLDKIEALEKRLGGLTFQMMTQAEFDSNPPKDKHIITIIDPEE